MKKAFLPVILGLLFAFTACNQSDPVEYNDKIVEQYNAVYNAIDSLDNLLYEDELNEDLVQEQYDVAVSTVDQAIKRIKDLGAFNGDDHFQTAAIEYFERVKDVLENDYPELIDLSKRLESEDFDEDAWDSYFDKIDELYDKLSEKEDALFDAQWDFADEYGITIK
jgi:hypothetical protein